MLTFEDLGTPIDLERFMNRPDIPQAAKDRVKQAGGTPNPASEEACAEAYRNMQARALMEVEQLQKIHNCHLV